MLCQYHVNIRCGRIRGEGLCDCWEGESECQMDDSGDNVWGKGWVKDKDGDEGYFFIGNFD